MSLFGSIGKVLGKIAAPVLSVIPGVGPIAGTILGAAAQKVLGGGGGGGGGGINLPALPGGARMPAGLPAIAGAAAGGYLGGINWDTPKKRRRRKGITAKDLTSFKRVARLVDKYAKPVHHFRNIKK